jgi:hypothetical protein
MGGIRASPHKVCRRRPRGSSRWHTPEETRGAVITRDSQGYGSRSKGLEGCGGCFKTGLREVRKRVVLASKWEQGPGSNTHPAHRPDIALRA